MLFASIHFKCLFSLDPNFVPEVQAENKREKNEKYEIGWVNMNTKVFICLLETRLVKSQPSDSGARSGFVSEHETEHFSDCCVPLPPSSRRAPD